jgi:SAM-dependent methyltransferase
LSSHASHSTSTGKPPEGQNPCGGQTIRGGWERAAADYRKGFGLHLEEIAHRLAALLPASLPSPVLDLACGPGTVLWALKGRQRPDRSVGCDFSHRMLGFSRERVALSHGVVADQDLLPFAPQSFGTVVSSMGTIFSRDPEGQIRTISRILVPGGIFGFSAWGRPEETELGAVSRRIVADWPHPFDGTLPPLESPYSPGRSDWLDRVAGQTGFSVREVVSHWHRFRFPGTRSAAEAIAGTGRLALLLAGRPDLREELIGRAEAAFLPHRDPASGRVELSNRYHLFVLERKKA